MKYAEIEWRDGQPYSPGYDDIYFSAAGGREESEYVFLGYNNLATRWHELVAGEHFVIAETGFGTGLNFVLTLQAWQEHKAAGHIPADARLHYIAIEKHPVSPEDIQRVATSWPDLADCFDELLSVYPLPVEGDHCRSLLGGAVYLHLKFMDIIDALEQSHLLADAWYLDGFGPDRNADIWNERVFELVEKNSRQGATLATYTAAGFVRRGLQLAGFTVSKVKGHGKKREMITAVLSNKKPVQNRAPWYELEKTDCHNRQAVILGAGLAGLTTAWSLVQRGWQVTVIDRHKDVAEETSGNPAGLLMPRLSIDNKADAQFYSSALLYAAHCLDQLQKSEEERFWFHEGVYSIFKTGKTEKIIESNGYPEQFMQLLTGSDIPDVINAANASVSLLKEAGWASPKRICEQLVKVCGEALTLIEKNVNDIQKIEQGWQLLDEQGRSIILTDVLVLANGVAINQFEQLAWLPVLSVRGQVTEIPATEKSTMLNRAVSFDAYVTPAHNGKHIAGASYHVGDNNTALTQAEQDENMQRLEQCLPGLFTPPGKLNGRVGFRAVSEDRVPIIGAVPNKQQFQQDYIELHHGRPNAQYPGASYLSGLYVNVAHGSRGICSSFLSAEILASMIVNEPLPVNKVIIDQLSPARFLVRKLRRGESL
ncbi:MAG: bifunctional tRNA (5-methylaminomethyl-2-thiouridine)(34)-methyltransferase MnmD/FAD-dependent 5-carboxymethylaminomethyl-2-thiouridine(34) oxidoreductase MnmC [Gammaproteobacteria bacterium]|nr:bifunctional tRNA (5-methylaminomethyl-2-thiouridine)(34)-methyltransferase MnmD/FAD-dependent 5-carboxymethylaminomethyl-2-thiouridine(34) oxidoreductase MnmC [Gammaproteobacteria bacterium]